MAETYTITGSAKAYEQAVRRELATVLKIMETTWGQAPELTLRVTPVLRLSVDFKMKGFAHKGAGVYVHAGNLERMTPAVVCRRLAGEVVIHRDQCAECGDVRPPMHNRLRQQEFPDAEPHLAVITEGRVRYRKVLKAELPLFDLPPDAVEAHVFPGMAKKLLKLLEKRRLEREAQAKRVAEAKRKPRFEDCGEGPSIGTNLQVRDCEYGTVHTARVLYVTPKHGVMYATVELPGSAEQHDVVVKMDRTPSAEDAAVA